MTPGVSVASTGRLQVTGPSHTQEAAVIHQALHHLVITPRAGGQAGRRRPRCDGMGGGRGSFAAVVVVAAVAVAVAAAATKGAAVVVVVVVLGRQVATLLRHHSVSSASSGRPWVMDCGHMQATLTARSKEDQSRVYVCAMCLLLGVWQ